jgi:hypothetical protein
MSGGSGDGRCGRRQRGNEFESRTQPLAKFENRTLKSSDPPRQSAGETPAQRPQTIGEEGYCKRLNSQPPARRDRRASRTAESMSPTATPGSPSLGNATGFTVTSPNPAEPSIGLHTWIDETVNSNPLPTNPSGTDSGHRIGIGNGSGNGHGNGYGHGHGLGRGQEMGCAILGR